MFGPKIVDVAKSQSLARKPKRSKTLGDNVETTFVARRNRRPRHQLLGKF